MEKTSNGPDRFSVGSTPYDPHSDGQVVEASLDQGEAALIAERCDTLARRSLLANLDPQTARILGVYISEHRDFFDIWEGRFMRFAETPPRGDGGVNPQYKSALQDLARAYEEHRTSFSARWRLEVSQFSTQSENELAKARIVQILAQAQMRDRVVSTWIHNIVSSYEGVNPLSDRQAFRDETEIEEANVPTNPRGANANEVSGRGFLTVVGPLTRNRLQRKTL